MRGETPARHWASIGETTFVTGIQLLCAIERWLGRWPFRLCLAPVVLAHWLLDGRARRASQEYLQQLQQAHAVFTHAPGAWRSLRHFACFAETLLDKLLASRGRFPPVQVEGVAVMRTQMVRGQGGVIVTAHLGCLELCQALADRVPELRVTALVHTAHAEDFNRLLARLNPNGRVRLLQVTALDAAMAVRLGERVAAGEFIAIAGDRVPLHGGRCVWAPFLGRLAPFPIGPYVLAAALGCPLFAMACIHGGAGYRLSFECFSERVLLPRATRETALTEQAKHYANWLETQLCYAPLDWFNFFPFWDQYNDVDAVH
ncbi:MAG: acyltransferase [Thermomonas sp.]|uniref:acyltransferase n=1 Tax=Thermomonas sp. TaxID=1971895 RepID=UPI001EC5332D|nr:acyltransferase [Thermomonas sp.]MBV2209036.1 acyltransferase [Thermomonas sp.]